MFVGSEHVRRKLEGKRVAIVGSAPSCDLNEPGFIDDHEVVVRINNYKLTPSTGKRTDIFYSFFGNSIRKHRDELMRDGVYLCLCKCPDVKFIESDWHRKRGKMPGVDFRYIYKKRKGWWFCPTYIPSTSELMDTFEQLGNRMPTTGFACIKTVMAMEPGELYVTGFDFFQSRVHNVDEPWRPGDPRDPIGHDAIAEKQWLKERMNQFIPDETMRRSIERL